MGSALSVASQHLFMNLSDELTRGVRGFWAAIFGIKAEEPGKDGRAVNGQVWRGSTGTLRPRVNRQAQPAHKSLAPSLGLTLMSWFIAQTSLPFLANSVS